MMVSLDESVLPYGISYRTFHTPIAESKVFPEGPVAQPIIRKAFGDTDKEHRIIETIPKSGYRLIAPILHPNSSPALSSEVINSTYLPAKKMKAIIGATALAAMIIAITWWQPWMEREQPLSIDRMAFLLPDKPSIAVLPFTNMSDDPEQGYFADGMTEDLITDLSKIPGLFVIARNSTFAYKNKSVKIH
jgi:hypothetical protein